MSSFQTIIQRVAVQVIDLPSAVQSQIPSIVNETLKKIQDLHSFNCMRMELGFNNTLYTNPEGAGTSPGLWQPHIIGAVANTPVAVGTFLATNFKEFKGNPYYQRQIGSTCEFVFEPNAQYAFREWNPLDPNAKGPPQGLYLSDPIDNYSSRNLCVFPYSDTNSDWTTAPVGEYRIHIPYSGYLPALVNPGDTNWFTENATRALVFLSIAEAFFINWDEQRATMWEARALQPRQAPNGRYIPSVFDEAIYLDKSTSAAPVKNLVPRRDVFAPRDQWRT